MTRWPLLFVTTAMMPGCGTQSSQEPAELAEVCGSAGPFQLLPLPPERSFRGCRTVDGELLCVLGDLPRPGAPERTRQFALWSSGPCGESRHVAIDEISGFFSDERWPDLLLGCRESQRDIVTIDPTGSAPPHVVFADIDCWPVRTAHGYVSLDPGGDQLVLHRFPVDPLGETSTPSLLVADLPEQLRYTVLDDMVFFVDGDSSLVRVDLADGTTTVEQTGVHSYAVSPDGRYVLWQDTLQTGAGPFPEGAVILQDRETGQGLGLARTALARGADPFEFYADGLVGLTLPDDVRRIYSLPGVEFVDLPRRLNLAARTGDGRWLMQSSEDGAFYLGELRSDASPTPFFDQASVIALTPDGATLLSSEPPHALWSAPYDGSAPRRLAERASESVLLLDDDRLITVVDVEEHVVGDLVLVDTNTRDEYIVDERIYPFSPALYPALGDDIIWYAVLEGERAGMWLARLPAAD